VIIGHYGVSFVLKRAHPAVPLWHYIVAVELLDILHSAFVIVGLEKAAIVPGATALVPVQLIYYPFTHSLVASVVLSLSTFGLYRFTALGGTDRTKAGALMALGVFSHFVLDYLTHNPDLPILGEDWKVGLGLWNYLVPAFVVENVVLFGALLVYLRGTRPIDALGKYGMLVLCLMGTALLAGFPLGVLPSDIVAAEAFALFSYAFVCVASWIFDKRRLPF
jgi:membrane-bound metal-dependent hydrolase YbcI (DUF457 family)